ncbi:hypothetical protein ACFS2C_03210 [Prauserella oleivorans]|uniref:Uncharacterized protein n=1 Tax=Prauserella oleivorans TaxID=1478153 RepID=A0ABW5W719_9PSEU
MTEHERAPEDPTAEWLQSVRAEETPWRVDRPPRERPAVEPEAGASAPAAVPVPTAQTVARAVGAALPGVPGSILVAWAAAEALDALDDGGGCEATVG